jgi:hypothetical protein
MRFLVYLVFVLVTLHSVSLAIAPVPISINNNDEDNRNRGLVPLGPVKPPSTFGKGGDVDVDKTPSGCTCTRDNCGCCVWIDIPDPKFQADACVNLTYIPATWSLALTVSFDGITVYNETVSLKDPDICFPVPQLPVVDFCVDFSHMVYNSTYISGCIDVSMKVVVTIFDVFLGCFRLPV